MLFSIIILDENRLLNCIDEMKRWSCRNENIMDITDTYKFYDCFNDIIRRNCSYLNKDERFYMCLANAYFLPLEMVDSDYCTLVYGDNNTLTSGSIRFNVTQVDIVFFVIFVIVFLFLIEIK